MIKFLDLASIHKRDKALYLRTFKTILESGQYILGEQVNLFEEEFAHYCGAKYCVGVGSGLDALTIILRALDLKPGDEVIVPANTFIATFLAASHNNLLPLPADPDRVSMVINGSSVKPLINSNTKVIIAVHLYGHPCAMEELLEIADDKGIYVIEDAAQAHGAEYKTKRIGSSGIASAFSFYPGKNLGALGDGGAIVTNNEKLSNRCRELRNYGSRNKYNHNIKGFNSRLDEIQAAFLRNKLNFLDSDNLVRNKAAKEYLSNIINKNIILPVQLDDAKHAWHQFVIRTAERDRLAQYLLSKGIETMVHYPVPPHKQPAYKELRHTRLPVTEDLAKTVLSLPINVGIKRKDIEYVIECVNKWT